MTQLTSYNGWPASKDVESIRIKSYAIKGSKVKLRCAYFAAPLLVAFAEDFNELIEPIDGGALDDWGYCYREVRQVNLAYFSVAVPPVVKRTAIDRLDQLVKILSKGNQ